MRHLVLPLLASLAISACAGPIALGEGRVSGLVGYAPSSPLGNAVGPAANKTVQFVPMGGGSIQSATSGSDGRYLIDLSPGTYEVRLVGYAPAQLYYGKNPKTYGRWPQATIIRGQETMLDLIYDSGIR
jgi:hypothetical protein